jgi:hypothetical protein
LACLDVASTHGPSTRSIFFQSRRSYRPAEGRVEAKRCQRPGPPPATTNRLLAEPGGGPWVNCAWVEVSRGRFVGGRIVKAPSISSYAAAGLSSLLTYYFLFQRMQLQFHPHFYILLYSFSMHLAVGSSFLHRILSPDIA